MPTRASVSVVSVREFFRAGADARVLIPELPGLYLWTLDLLHLATAPRPARERMTEELARLLRSSSREFAGRIEPYYAAQVKDEPRELGTEKIGKLLTLLDSDRARWLLLCGTVFQRPLYVGIARNLAARIQSHMDSGSLLREYLTRENINVLNCSVQFLVCEDLIADAALADSDLGEIVEDSFPILQVAEALVMRLARPLLNRRIE